MSEKNVTRSFITALILFASAIISIGCKSSKSVQTPVALIDSLSIPKPIVVEDTVQKVDELDYVAINTDTRINPVRAIRLNLLTDGGYTMSPKSDEALGVSFNVPNVWADTKQGYKNLVNYYTNGKINILTSVSNATFDSINIWAQVQEAISFGKNQLPKTDWRLDSTYEARIGVSQSYYGRYAFGGKQYNMAFFRASQLQYNLIIDHPLNDTLTDGETQALNAIMASYAVLGPPKVDIPKPVQTVFTVTASKVEEPVKTTKKKTTSKKKTRKKGK